MNRHLRYILANIPELSPPINQIVTPLLQKAFDTKLMKRFIIKSSLCKAIRTI